MKIVKANDVPIYEVTCEECKSVIRYKACEVAFHHITCPVCGISLWANTVRPVAYESQEASKNAAVIIDNQEMPKCCEECFALDDNGDYPRCRITNEQRGYTFNTRNMRMDKCPLREIKITRGKIYDNYS